MAAAMIVWFLAQTSVSAPPPATPTPPVSILLARPVVQEAPPQSGSLAAVARHIKLKLPPGQGRVLNNEAVKQLAEGVNLTTGQPGPAIVLGGGRSGAADGKRSYWQGRYQAAVARVAGLESTVAQLESEVNRLQREFYSRDDPAFRDGVIKPRWDKATADLQTARAELEQSRAKPDQVINEARRDGAEPGWFRDLPEPAGELALSATSLSSPPESQPTVKLAPTPAPTPTKRPPTRRRGDSS
jgi:hypothetical protein